MSLSRFYQNVLTGQKVEVKTLDEDDFYMENSANWSRIPEPPAVERPEPVAAPIKHAPKKKG